MACHLYIQEIADMLCYCDSEVRTNRNGKRPGQVRV